PAGRGTAGRPDRPLRRRAPPAAADAGPGRRRRGGDPAGGVAARAAPGHPGVPGHPHARQRRAGQPGARAARSRGRPVPGRAPGRDLVPLAGGRADQALPGARGEGLRVPAGPAGLHVRPPSLAPTPDPAAAPAVAGRGGREPPQPLGPAQGGGAALASHHPAPISLLPASTRAAASAVGLLVLVIAYLLVGTQATQTSYEVDNLRDRSAQLQADQGQLRYQDARMHTQARIAQSATSAGLQHGNPPRYAGYQPVALDLAAPIGPDRPADTPLWQRAVAALIGSAARDAQAAGR